jgi:hypothetical protein
MATLQRKLGWVLAATLAAYLLTLGVTIWLHWRLGPPHTQPSLSLMLAFGLFAAFLGLSSILVALAALHWTRRASGLLAGVAVLGLFFRPFFDWDQFLIWQLLVMLGTQTGCIVVALVIARSLGWGLAFTSGTEQGKGEPASTNALRFSISDMLIFAAAVGLLFAVMRGSHPMNLNTVGWGINIAGGCGAAIVGLTVLWSCFGAGRLPLRALALFVVAPMGGLVYFLAARYAPLLFSWQWYAGVTSAQVAFMTIPCLILRATGLRFVRRTGQRGLSP